MMMRYVREQAKYKKYVLVKTRTNLGGACVVRYDEGSKVVDAGRLYLAFNA